ncbi:sugar ABC transporter ATP-binding protein [Celeribacter indicus]|uniref:Ribose ABC transporter n=1 Tax=Celeribacter indicus TaxID=1208324 RepID=A0A0B5DW07_9RHOB|nr:sugar ABC transporter ATP-binding protein [Celeribacter indicus]AJE44946.1 ribose ABC transporter [Celeribacter indicus]SDW96610.1 ribose transport system ATP-binding protein [Celeribacter indicus]
MKSEIFSARGIGKTFGSTVALEDVGFDLHAGRITGLVGMNGAGKSTLLQILAGALQPDTGTLEVDGRKVDFHSTEEALRAGIAIVSQELSLFSSLSVEENLALVKGHRSWPSRAAFRADARRILHELGFDYDLGIRLVHLTLADQQLVEIARALLQQPRVLILDEPTSSLHSVEVQRLHRQLIRLREEGVSIVYVSHFLEDLLDVCDTAVVLRNGHRVEAPDLRAPDSLPRLVAAMLGDEATDSTLDSGTDAPLLDLPDRRANGPLRISGLTTATGLDIDDLTVAPGEIYGISGLIGSGVTDLFGLLFGLQTARSGEVVLPSGRSAAATPPDAVRAGVAYLPADRKAVALMQRQTIAENIGSVRALGLGGDGAFIRRKRMVQRAEERCVQLGIRMASVHQTVSELSGGNQQKVVFAKWLEAEPSLLLLDDPTRGIDIHARLEIHRTIRDLARSGLVVLVYSSDPGEVVELADRVGVFADGRLVGELRGEDRTEHNLIVMMNSTNGAAAGPTQAAS